MDPSRIRFVLARLYSLGRLMHPNPTLQSLRSRVRLLLGGVLSIQEVRWWYGISDNQRLASALSRYPLMHGSIYWPYIHKDWPRRRRLEVIDRHYRMLEGDAAILAQAVNNDIELLSLGEKYMGLRLVVGKSLRFEREGETMLHIFRGDLRLYSAAFALGIEAGEHVAYLGAVQGCNLDEAKDYYRQITHALHGLRPRDFLMDALKLFCESIGVRKIWAVSGEARLHKGRYFGELKRAQILSDYNQIWLENGGTDLGNGFFEIPAGIRYREASGIPTRKRANYRRRYAFLDELAVQIGNVCAAYTAKPGQPQAFQSSERN
jgi:uncharacterized protein VirK/YbjX